MPKCNKYKTTLGFNRPHALSSHTESSNSLTEKLSDSAQSTCLTYLPKKIARRGCCQGGRVISRFISRDRTGRNNAHQERYKRTTSPYDDGFAIAFFASFGQSFVVLFPSSWYPCARTLQYSKRDIWMEAAKHNKLLQTLQIRISFGRASRGFSAIPRILPHQNHVFLVIFPIFSTPVSPISAPQHASQVCRIETQYTSGRCAVTCCQLSPPFSEVQNEPVVEPNASRFPVSSIASACR